MICPSCGREIPDDVEICPYCTANVKGRISVKKVYIISLILIIVGATYSALAYTSSEVPVTKIGSLGVGDNYKFVHVSGVVADYPRVYESEYGISELMIPISDGTGELTVKLYRNLVDRAVAQNKVPGVGDIVDASGIFSYTTRKSLTVNELKNLRIIHRGYQEISVGKVASSAPWSLEEGEAVNFVGNITGMREYTFGYIASVDESLDIVIPRSYVSLNLIDLKNISSGVVEIFGVLKFYRPISPPSSYIGVDLRDVMKNPEKYNGTNMDVPWARIIEKHEENNTLIIEENGSKVQVYVWYGVEHYDVGDNVEVAGKFINYHGSWEIKVTRKTDFISRPRWEVIMHPRYNVLERKEYKNTTEFHLHDLVSIRGIVADYSKVGSGLLITLWSNGKSYDVYVENVKSVHGVVDYGVKIAVNGMVTIYRGSYEIKVRAFTNDAVEVIT